MRRYHSHLLAGTALIGISTLGAADPAIAACAGNPLICSGATTATQVNAGILTLPVPNAAVTFDSTAVIDTSAGGGGSVIVPNTYNGVVSITSAAGSVVGKVDGTTDAFGLFILGDKTAAGNNASITVGGNVFGFVNIGAMNPALVPGFGADPGGIPVGGTGTVTLNASVAAALFPPAGLAGTVGIWSLGDATLTATTGSNIYGGVGLLSRITNTVAAVPNVSYGGTSQVGGKASATIASTVGAVDSTGTFVSAPIRLTGASEADLELQSGAITGNVTLRAGVTTTTNGNVKTVDGAGNTVNVTKAFTDKVQGAAQGFANLTVDAGAQLLGTADIIGWQQANAIVNGTVGTGLGAPTVVLKVQSPQSSTEITTTTVTDPALVQIHNTIVNATIPSGGGVTVTVGAGALVDGQLTAGSIGNQVVSIAGQVGRLKPDGTKVSGDVVLATGPNGGGSAPTTTTDNTVKNSPAGITVERELPANNFVTTYTPAGIQLNLASTGNVYGSITGTGTGVITAQIDGTAGNLIAGGNGLTFDNTVTSLGLGGLGAGNPVINESKSDKQLFDGVTALLTQEITTDDKSVLGAGINLTISKTGIVYGPVSLNSTGPIVVQNDGSIRATGIPSSGIPAGTPASAGSLTAQSQLNNIQTKNNSTLTITPTIGTGTVENLRTYVQDTIIQTLGSTVSITNTSANSIQGPVTVNALGDVSFTNTNTGWAIGPVTLTSNGSMREFQDNSSFDTLTVQADSADPTKGSTTTVHYSETVTNPFGNDTTLTGGNVSGTYDGIIGDANQGIDFVGVGAAPALGKNYIVQAANKNSTAVIPTTGQIMANIGIGAGVTNVGAITVTTGNFQTIAGQNNVPTVPDFTVFTPGINRTDTQVSADSFVIQYDGKAPLPGNAVTGSQSYSQHNTTTTTVPAGAAASLDVQGAAQVLKQLNPTTLKNDVILVYGPSGAKVTVGGTANVAAWVSANAAPASLGSFNVTTDTLTTQTSTILGKGAIGPTGNVIADKLGDLVETSFFNEAKTTTTSVGADASITTSGTGKIGSTAVAIGLTSATVTATAGSVGSVQAIIDPNSTDTVNDVTTTRVYATAPANPFQYTNTTTTNFTQGPSALAGAATVTAANLSQRGIVAANSPSKDAKVTLTGTVAYEDPAAGSLVGNSKLEGVQAIAASGSAVVFNGGAAYAPNAYQTVTSTTSVQTGFTTANPVVAVPAGAGGFGVNPVINPTQNLSLVSTTTKTSVGGAASVSLTADSKTIAGDPTKDFVFGDVKVIGDKSATLTVATGTRIDGAPTVLGGPVMPVGIATVTSLPTKTITTQNYTYKNISPVATPLADGSLNYVFDSKLDKYEVHFTGGTATVTNAGQIRGGAQIMSAGTTTSTLTNSGILGALTTFAAPPTGVFVSSNLVTSLQSDLVQTVTGTNLSDVDHATVVTVNTYTGVGGTSTATNTGTIVGNLQIAGKTATVTNSGSLGSSATFTEFAATPPTATLPFVNAGFNQGKTQVGYGLGGLLLGQSLAHFTQTITQTATSTVADDTKGNSATPFVQTITANQNGVLLGGIVVGSASSQSDSGGGASQLGAGTFNGVFENIADAFQPLAGVGTVANTSNNGTVRQTTTINATINIGDNSLTLGGPEGVDPGGANAPGLYAILGQRNTAQGSVTKTNVNLNGNNWIGAHIDESLNDAGPTDADEGFQVAPKLTADQYAFLYGMIAPAGTPPQTFLNGYELHQAAAIVGVATLTRNAGGTTYFTGIGFDDRHTPTTADDFNDIQATNFNINSGGEVQFANLSIKDVIPEGSRPIDHNPYSIKSVVSNSGTFVMGARIQTKLLPNLTSLLAPQTEFINGVNFRVDGSFTQTSTGTTVLSVFPALMRPTNPGFVGLTAKELLSTPAGGVGFLPFTTTNNFIGNTMGFLPDVSYMTINGNLTLAGTIQVDTLRDSLYVGGSSIPVFTVNGTATLTSPVVTQTFSSPFVGFGVTSAAGPVAGQTIVSVVVNRSSYASAGQSVNEKAAAVALDADLPGVAQKITDDANGKKVFSSVQEFIRVQDEATIMSGLDWQLSAPDASRALKDLSGDGQYGSLMALDHTRDLANTFEDYFGAATPMDAPGVTWWLTPTYRGTDFDGSKSRGAADMRSDQLGLLAGAQVRMSPNWGAGAGIGYGHDRATVSDSGHTNINTFMVGGNVHYAGDQFNIGVQLDYGYNTYNSDRDLPFLARATDASFNGHELRGRIEGGWRVPLSGGANGTLLPYIALDIIDREIHGFKESTVRGGGIALNVDSQSDTEFDPKLGVRWNGAGWNTGMFVLAPLADLTYTFSDPSTGSDLGFVGGTTTFHTLGVNPGGFVTIQGGLFGAIGSAGSLGIKAGGDFGSNRTGAMGSLVFRMQL